MDLLSQPKFVEFVGNRMGPNFARFKTGGTVQGIKKALEGNHGALLVLIDEFLATFAEVAGGDDGKAAAERAEFLTILSGGLPTDNALATKEAPAVSRCCVSGVGAIQVRCVCNLIAYHAESYKLSVSNCAPTD